MDREALFNLLLSFFSEMSDCLKDKLRGRFEKVFLADDFPIKKVSYLELSDLQKVAFRNVKKAMILYAHNKIVVAYVFHDDPTHDDFAMSVVKRDQHARTSFLLKIAEGTYGPEGQIIDYRAHTGWRKPSLTELDHDYGDKDYE